MVGIVHQEFAPRHVWYALQYAHDWPVTVFSLTPDDWPDSLDEIDQYTWHGKVCTGVYVDAPDRNTAQMKAKARLAEVKR